MFHILLLLITRLESLATVPPGLEEKCVKLSVLQTNLQASLLKHFFILSALLPTIFWIALAMCAVVLTQTQTEFSAERHTHLHFCGWGL